MKKLNLLAVGVLFALTGCKDLNGILSVRETIVLKNESNDQVQIGAGNYSTALKVNSKRKVGLEVKLVSGKKTTFIFKTDKNLKKLKSGDRIQVAAATSGQPYDIDGIYQVTSSNSLPHRTVESCTYTTVEWRCRNVTMPNECKVVKECNPSNPNQCQDRNVCTGGETRQECGNVNVSHPGHQEVEYYHTTTTESVRMQLLTNRRIVTDFSGSDSISQKHYTFQGICR